MALVIKDDFASGYDSIQVLHPFDMVIKSNKEQYEDNACNKILEVKGVLQRDTNIFVPKEKNQFVIFNNTKGNFKIFMCCKDFETNKIELKQGYKTAIQCLGAPNYSVENISGKDLL